MNTHTRRDFLKHSAAMGAAAISAGTLGAGWAHAAAKKGSKMDLGLVTYLWAKDWDLPTIITNCEKTNVLGIEFRTTHAHGVERDLDKKARKEIKKRLADSKLKFVGIGSNECYCHVDPARLEKAIADTKDFIKLSHDIGGSGVKVKPNDFHEGVPHEKTIEQIGKSLNKIGAFGADLGQKIRLEVHGKCCELPTIKQIMDVADHPNVYVCWNCNDQDLNGEGLEYNFNLVKDRFGDTVHVRELNIGKYPYQQLMDMFVQMDYAGWILLEARTNPDDKVAALAEQRKMWEQMIANAQKKLG